MCIIFIIIVIPQQFNHDWNDFYPLHYCIHFTQLLPAAASGKSPGGSKSPGTSSRIPGPSRVSAPGSGSSHLKKPTSGTYSQTSPGKHKSGHSPPSKGKGAAPQIKEVPTIETSPASAANPTPAVSQTRIYIYMHLNLSCVLHLL